jgi:voltage-gated potassium channel
LWFAIGLLIAIGLGGTLGYWGLGLAPLDALYQTVITVTTVGFREIGDVDGRFEVFTIVVVLVGTSTTLYTFGIVLEILIEGRLTDHYRRQRMERDIAHLRGHVILCGYGQVGRAITDSLERSGHNVVIIDREETIEEVEDHYWVHGDATDDSFLRTAGLEHASTLICAMDSDSDNLFVTLSARAERPDLFIVARATNQSVEPKLRRAGANQVVNPHQIGGSRMAALVLENSRPGGL